MPSQLCRIQKFRPGGHGSHVTGYAEQFKMVLQYTEPGWKALRAFTQPAHSEMGIHPDPEVSRR